MEDDRREFTRFSLQTDEVQIFCDDAILFGNLNDISTGGLSFKYTPVAHKMVETNIINILAKGKDQLNLYHIDCRTIYDISAEAEAQRVLDGERRQCGIKFFWLKEAHKIKLALLLDHYIVKSFDRA